MFVVIPFHRRQGRLRPGEVERHETEAAAFRSGRAQQARTDGLAFFRIDTHESGDQWTKVELLTAVGDVPPDLEGAA